jgi:Recombination endonuclease VII
MYDKKARARTYYLANKESVIKRTNAWRKANPEVNKLSARKVQWRLHGILNEAGQPFSTVDFDRLYQIQQGKCVGCEAHQSELNRSLCVDHNHETKKVRGLLCAKCNTALGQANDNINILKRLVIYMNKHQETI